MIPKKNYIILSIIVLLIVIITVSLSLIYKRNEVKEFSYIYDKISELNSKDFFNYMLETPDCIIYVSNKYNLNNNQFEKQLVYNLKKENLLDLAVFLEYDSLNKKFKKEFKDEFSYNLDDYSSPVVIIYADGSIINIQSIDSSNSDISEIINYEALK